MCLLAVVLLPAAGLLTAATAWTDWRCRRIPDWISVALLVLWGLSAVFAPEVLGGPRTDGLVCGAVGLAVGFVLYSVGWLGGGDGKLLGLVGLWLGPGNFGLALLGGSALMAVLMVPAFAGARAAEYRKRGIPFACALAPPTVLLLANRSIELFG